METSKSVQQKINDGDYKSKLLHGQFVKKPILLSRSAERMSYEEIVNLPTIKKQYEDEVEFQRNLTDAYQKDQAKLYNQMLKDIFEELDVDKDNVVIQALWNDAYEQGHSAGYGEVYGIFSNHIHNIWAAVKTHTLQQIAKALEKK